MCRAVQAHLSAAEFIREKDASSVAEKCVRPCRREWLRFDFREHIPLKGLDFEELVWVRLEESEFGPIGIPGPFTRIRFMRE
jgi:hypothetical protein